MGENLPQFSGWKFQKIFELPPPRWMYPYQRTPMGNPYKSTTQPNNDHLLNPLDFRPATNNKPLATSAYFLQDQKKPLESKGKFLKDFNTNQPNIK